jgi:CheY-like chemotaxis protein
VPDRLRGDPIRLRQILVNLAGNAVKFTDRGEIAVKVELGAASGGARRQDQGAGNGEGVTEPPHSTAQNQGTGIEQQAAVACSQSQSHSASDNRVLLRFSVKDTGIGIPAEKRSLLFEKFSQVDASSTRRFGGTGLGLAIARQLTDLMGGRIGVEADADQGTTFWLTLELLQGEEEDADGNEPVGDAATAPSDIRGARILVVDDNETNRQVLMTQLRAWGFRAREAADGPSALAVLREAREEGAVFRAAILDMQMPGMDGLALAQVIRNEPACAAMRLILLTSMGHTGEGRQFKQAGFSAWLPKPVRASTLFDVLHETLAVRVAPPAVEKLTPGLSGRVNIGSLRVLLVEDNEVNRMVAEGMLRKMGLRSVAAENGADALAALARDRYDLILMDVQMPVMDGLEATKRIRGLESGTGSQASDVRSQKASRRIPIVAMTAHAMQGDREKCLNAGMDDYIAKPISPKALADVLAKWLPKSNSGGKG